jgi:hypothetical protein
MTMARVVVVQVLALHVGCDACGTTTRIVPDCDLYATWASAHMLPRVVEAEVLVDGAHCVRPVRAA